MAAASVAAELAVRPSTAVRRRATLISRRSLDYVERAQLVAVGTAFGTAAAFLVIAACFGHADDKGRPGRWLHLSSLDQRYGWTILWPGAYYAVPLLVALAVTLLAIGATLRRIAARLVAASGLASTGVPWNILGVVVWVVVAGVAAIGGWSAAVLVTPGRVRRRRATALPA
jgi:hypothetical protein